VAAGETYLSRFFVKFIEISAAGVATAVSGYVLAHLTGYMNAPQPVALQSPAALQIPATSQVRAAAPVTVSAAPVAAPVTTPAPLASAPASPAPTAPVRVIATTPQQQDAKSAPLRKSLPADKPADTANASDGQPRSADAIAAEVRAALAKVDAAHPAKADAAHPTKGDAKVDAKVDAKADTRPEAAPRRAERPAEVATRTPAADAKPRPVETPTGAIANIPRSDAPRPETPRAAEITPPSAPPQFAPQPQPVPQPQPASQSVTQPGPQAPMQIAPPTTTVEIKSVPVAGVDATQPSEQTDAQAQPTDGGLFSIFKRLPEKLRDDKPLPADQAPRPPADVGQ
jgi:hypothetical protein